MSLYENYTDIKNNGAIGIGNVFDLTMTGISSIPVYGTFVSMGYMGADWLFFQYYGQNIRNKLNRF